MHFLVYTRTVKVDTGPIGRIINDVREDLEEGSLEHVAGDGASVSVLTCSLVLL
jgi:hypothetical protein